MGRNKTCRPAERPLKLSHIYSKQAKTSCSIAGCGNTSTTVADRATKVLFHQFPNRVFDLTRFRAWCNFAKLLSVNSSDRICSDHFLPTDYADSAKSFSCQILPQSYLGHHFNPNLKRTAVPSVRPPHEDDGDDDCLQMEVTEDYGGPDHRERRDFTPSSLMWYWTDRSVVYVDMHGFGYKLLKQGNRHMYFACSQSPNCSGKTMTSKRFKNPRMLSGHTHDTGKMHLNFAKCWQLFKRFTKEHYTKEKDEIIILFKLTYPRYAEALDRLHIGSSMDRWINDVHNIRPRSPDDFDPEDVSAGELSDSESIPPMTTTVSIFHNPTSVYTKCSVPSCNSYFDSSRKEFAGKQYFPFPKNPETRQLWIRAIGKPDDWDPKDSLVCSSHFIQSSFGSQEGSVPSHKELQEGAVPSLLLETESPGYTEDPLAAGYDEDDEDCEIYDVDKEEFIYPPLKTVDIPSKGSGDSPLSIPVVQVDRLFLQRAKAKAKASRETDLSEEEAEAIKSEEISEASSPEDFSHDPLEDVDEPADEMQSLMANSVQILSSLLQEKKNSSAANKPPSVGDKKRVLSNHEIFNNADNLIKNRFKSKNSSLISRPRGRRRKKDAVKVEEKKKTNSLEKRVTTKPRSKSPKKKRTSSEEFVDPEDQLEWRPSKQTVAKWTKAGAHPVEPKKRQRENKISESEDEEDEEAGYTIVEPLNIKMNLNNGLDGGKFDGENSLSLSEKRKAKVRKQEPEEVPPFKKRLSAMATRKRSNRSNSSDIELIEESSSQPTRESSEEKDDVQEVEADVDVYLISEDDIKEEESPTSRLAEVYLKELSSAKKRQWLQIASKEKSSKVTPPTERIKVSGPTKASVKASTSSSKCKSSNSSSSALDWAFFKSILPEISKLNSRKKAALKIMILEKLNELLSQGVEE